MVAGSAFIAFLDAFFVSLDPLLLGSVIFYGYEAWQAVQLIRTPRDTGPIYTLVYILLVAYAIGLARAWELLGATRTGLFRALLGLGRERAEASADAGAGSDDEPRD